MHKPLSSCLASAALLVLTSCYVSEYDAENLPFQRSPVRLELPAADLGEHALDLERVVRVRLGERPSFESRSSATGRVREGDTTALPGPSGAWPSWRSSPGPRTSCTQAAP